MAVDVAGSLWAEVSVAGKLEVVEGGGLYFYRLIFTGLGRVIAEGNLAGAFAKRAKLVFCLAGVLYLDHVYFTVAVTSEASL